MTREELVILRANLLGGMNEYIINKSEDESTWERWITAGVPDGATEEDLMDIAADDELWTGCCVLFGKLINKCS